MESKTKKKLLLAGYFSSLKSPAERERYLEKLKHVQGVDLYETDRSEWQDDIDLWPSISHIHLGMYLLYSPSSYTGEDLLNYRSLDCYTNFISGWVREVLVKPFNDKRAVIAKVNHSQKLSSKPLTPWIIAEDNGKVIASHCDCMAGLGESCTHIASVLFAIESGVRIRDSMTVTQKKAYWVMPTGVKEVQYAPVKDIIFCGRKRSAVMYESNDSRPSASRSPSLSPAPCSSRSSTPANPRTSKSPTPTSFRAPDSDEVSTFFSSLASCSSKPAILSLVEPYSSSYIPKSLNVNLPICLTELFKPEYLGLSYGDLLKLASNYEIKMTKEEAKNVEFQTRAQTNSRLWFRMRAGRITASRLKSVCCTNPAQPSMSLIMAICHPELAKFRSAATTWGCEHEKTAKSKYYSRNIITHQDFKLIECGLFINPEFPYMGASPDGIVTCSCCDEGICEIKCPHSHRKEKIHEAVDDTSFCLEKTSEGYKLKENHSYYYQVQCQMFCSKRNYCDFIVWMEDDLHVERIYPNENFWLTSTTKAKDFFQCSILPELFGKHYSRPTITQTTCQMQSSLPSSCTQQQTDEPRGKTSQMPGGSSSNLNDIGDPLELYCYCQRPEEGDMIGCDNPNCSFEWFHLTCLNLKSNPKCKFWYCPDCRRLPQFNKKSKKRKLM